MGSPAQALGAHGPGKSVCLDGQVWILTPSTQGMQIAFSELIKARAKKEFDADASDMRRRALPLWTEARRLQEEIEGGAIEVDEARKAELVERYEQVVAEARSLEFEARDSIDRFKQAKAAGEYEFYGEHGIRALGTTFGQVQMCLLMLKPKHPSITLGDVEKLHRGTVELDGETVSREDVLQHRGVKTFKGSKISRIEFWQICLLMADGLFEKKEPAPAPPPAGSDAAAPTPSSSSGASMSATSPPADAAAPKN